MRKQSSMISMRLPAGALCALVLFVFVCVGRAGEPIQFSNDKAKTAPANPQQPIDTDLFKNPKSKRPPSARLNNLTPFLIAPTMDSKDERRMKNIRDERKNWMLLEPGELQRHDEEEENKFGGRGVALDSAEEVKDGNYLLYNATGQKSERVPARQAPKSAPIEDDQAKKENRSLSIFGSRDAEKPGAHTSSELNLKHLIDPAQIDSSKFSKEASLFQFLKDNSAAPPDRDQQARRDNFRDFINGPQAAPAPSGLSDPINFRTDLTQERINPVTPSRSGIDISAPKGQESMPGKPGLAPGFAPARPVSLPDFVSSGTRQPMTGPSLPSPFLTPNDPSKATRPGVMNSGMFNREGPRRGGL